MRRQEPPAQHGFIICSYEPGLRRQIAESASRLGTVVETDSWDTCRELLGERDPRVLVVDADPWNEDENWLGRVAALQSIEHRLVVIMLSPNRDAENAIAAVGHGCFEYLIKPIDQRHLNTVLTEATRIVSRSPVLQLPALGREAPQRSPRHRAPAEREREGEGEGEEVQNDRAIYRPRLIGHSPAMLRVYKQIGQASPSDVEVLVTGESGTGKELVCRAIHDNSARKGRPFVAINCAAIPDTLLESELFGHEKGSFTGADRRRIGKFEQAEGGTVLLDEIGDMSPVLQAKILRLVQDRSFYRVGGNELLHADVRILAATHQPLEERIAEGRFRPDLFYRLRVVHIDLKPLRERDTDIILLAHHFAAAFNRELKRNITAFHPETNKRLLEHNWPGNVRELQNVVKQAMVVSQGTVLLPEFLPPLVALPVTNEERARNATGAPPATATSLSSSPASASRAPGGAWNDRSIRVRVDDGGDESSIDELTQHVLDEHDVDAYEKAKTILDNALVAEALRRHHGNISAAARHLGITRLTFRRKLEAMREKNAVE